VACHSFAAHEDRSERNEVKLHRMPYGGRTWSMMKGHLEILKPDASPSAQHDNTKRSVWIINLSAVCFWRVRFAKVGEMLCRQHSDYISLRGISASKYVAVLIR
jgi:hypothetical protein